MADNSTYEHLQQHAHIPQTPAQPPPPPPPTPVTGTPRTGAVRQTIVGFGTAEPVRHRYGSLAAVGGGRLNYEECSTVEAMELDEGNENEEDVDRNKIQPPQSRPRVVPRRLSIKTGPNRVPVWYPRTPAPYSVPHTPGYSLFSPTITQNYPDLITSENCYRCWELQYRFDQKGCGIDGAFALVVFLGGPSPPSSPVVHGIEGEAKGEKEKDLDEWVRGVEGLRIGGHGVSGGGKSITGDGRENINGSIPLTKALLERIAEVGGSLEVEKVIPYLKKNLHWVVERADGTIARLATLKVRIACFLINIDEEGGRRDHDYFDTLYTGKVGGLK